MPSQKLLDALQYQFRVNELVIQHPTTDPDGPALSPDELHAMQHAYAGGMDVNAFADLVIDMRGLRLVP